MKRILLIALAVIMVFALFSCADTAVDTAEPAAEAAGEPAEEGDTVAGSNTKLTMVSCESFSAGYPEGWTNQPYEDLFAEEEGALDPNTLYFVLGDPQDDLELLTCASVIITWSEPGTETMDMRDMYENVEDESFTLDGREWKGFTGDFGGARNVWLSCSDDEGLWQVSGYMDGLDEDSSYNTESEDFLAILDSIEKN